VASPALVASVEIYLISCTPLIACSSVMSVDFTSTSALAPGYAMKIFTVVGAMSGNCEIGSFLIANTPTKMMTTDITMANTGLRMNLLNMCTFLLRVGYSA
jgi:hypothetical protein